MHVRLYEFNADRPIIVTVRHIQIDPADPSGPTYSLSYARTLYFVANDDQGTFEFPPTIASDRKQRPGLEFSCWNTYLAGAIGTGLDTADNEQGFDTLSQYDVSWLINAPAVFIRP